MSRDISRQFLRSAVTAAIVTALFALSRFLSGHLSAQTVPLVLLDGLTISGVLLLIICFFSLLHRKGYLDWADYAVYLSKFLFNREKDPAFLNFYDFRDTVAYGKSPLWPGCALGAALLLAGALWAFLL